ncbi:hypothetical protein COCNU_scaffold009544G000020 [Cocos nucifera]|nr:hypothetical protein [Cocos nucifera]
MHTNQRLACRLRHLHPQNLLDPFLCDLKVIIFLASCQKTSPHDDIWFHSHTLDNSISILQPPGLGEEIDHATIMVNLRLVAEFLDHATEIPLSLHDQSCMAARTKDPSECYLVGPHAHLPHSVEEGNRLFAVPVHGQPTNHSRPVHNVPLPHSLEYTERADQATGPGVHVDERRPQLDVDLNSILLGIGMDGFSQQPERARGGAPGQQRHKHQRIGLRVASLHLLEELEPLGPVPGVHVAAYHRRPGDNIFLLHAVKEQAGFAEAAVPRVAGERGVGGDDVPVRDFVEQEVGNGEGGKCIIAKEG